MLEVAACGQLYLLGHLANAFRDSKVRKERRKTIAEGLNASIWDKSGSRKRKWRDVKSARPQVAGSLILDENKSRRG